MTTFQSTGTPRRNGSIIRIVPCFMAEFDAAIRSIRSRRRAWIASVFSRDIDLWCELCFRADAAASRVAARRRPIPA